MFSPVRTPRVVLSPRANVAAKVKVAIPAVAVAYRNAIVAAGQTIGLGIRQVAVLEQFAGTKKYLAVVELQSGVPALLLVNMPSSDNVNVLKLSGVPQPFLRAIKTATTAPTVNMTGRSAVVQVGDLQHRYDLP